MFSTLRRSGTVEVGRAQALLGQETGLDFEEILLSPEEFVAEEGCFLQALPEFGGQVMTREENFSIDIDIKALVGLREFVEIDGSMKPIAFADGGQFA